MVDTAIPDPVPPLTEEEKAAVEALYEKLKDEAKAAGHQWLMARTPPRLQQEMAKKADADFPPPEPVAPVAPPEQPSA